ncbi:hypothetical protein ACOBR2_18800 [Telmatobacter bradus]|uniref:hypothetical protein n=1 Tax=Telmatobacter bradus TaxID=474953 RepID=UPI003B43739B
MQIFPKFSHLSAHLFLPAKLFSAAVLLIPAALQAQRSATVTVDLHQSLTTISDAAYGVGTSVYDNHFVEPDLPAKLKAAHVSTLRYPGGSYSDIYHWRNHSATPGQTIYINPNDTFDNFMNKDVLPSGAQAMITVNYGSNLDGTGGGDPQEAAAWVRYANIEKKWNIRYWEIGNEVGGNGYFGSNGWELDLHSTETDKNKRVGLAALSQTAYGHNALDYIAAMKAVDPTIKLGVGIEVEDDQGLTHNAQLLKVVGTKIDFLIEHWYPHDSASNLAVTEQIPGRVLALRDQLEKIAGPSARNLPLAITETNGGAPGAARALFATDTFLTWFESGAFSVVWQELHPGFFSEGGDAQVDTPTEAYYGLQLAALAARPGDTLVKTTSSAPMFGAHGVRRSDGSTAVVLINRHPNQSYAVHLLLPDAPALASTAKRYDFGRANFQYNSPWAASGIQESSVTAATDGYTIVVPALSETAIVIPAAKP